MYNVTEGGQVVLKDCVLKEILNYVSGRLNFKYTIALVPEDNWGTKSGNEWNGAIGMVLRGEADVLPYLTITPTRYEAVEFSKPLTSVEYGLLVAFPAELPKAFIFLRLYKKEVWLLLFASAVFLSYVLCQMHEASDRFRRPRDTQKSLCSFSRCLWIVYGIMLQQGATRLPLTSSGRILLATWWLAVMVITTTYSANLIAFLAFPDVHFTVKSLQELVNHKTLSLTIKDGCPVLEDFEQSEVEVYKKIREVFLEDEHRSNILQTETRRCCAVPDVAEGRTVYVDDVNYLSWLVEDDYWAEGGRCRITVAPQHFSKMDLAVGLRRGSSLLKLLNDEIQQMKESGMLGYWEDKYSPQRDECYSVQYVLPGQSEINMGDLQGPFYLLLMGLLAGCLLFAGEGTYYRLFARKRTPHKNGTRSIYLQSKLTNVLNAYA